jgi:shikimate dehydrogenase
MSDAVNGQTEITGIFGHPVKHSLSPRMHNAAFRKLGLNMIYLPFDVRSESLREAMETIRMLNFVGVNLTHPHKIAALEHLDVLGDEAERIGAVNTVVNRDGALIGHNTDGGGFIQSLKLDYSFDPAAKHIVVFGAGGAGRAICTVLSRSKPKRLVIVERIFELAETVAAAVDGAALRSDDGPLATEISQADLVINATPGDLDLDPGWIREGSFLYDIRYGREEVTLIREFERRGGKIGDGRSMLLHQGALSFELWTGQKAPLETMRRALQAGNQTGYPINDPLEG